jgi:RNA polymerase sigma factor (TIGR02999 family)
MHNASDAITELYNAMRAGDETAKKRLFDSLYSELCKQARQVLRGEPRHDAIVTARGLVHETYQRLVGNMPEVHDRQHLLALLMQIMRRIKIDWARNRHRGKRNAVVSPLDTQNLRQAEVFENKRAHRLGPVEVIVIRDSLARLGRNSPHLANLLELYYFSGKTLDEIAADLNTPKTTVHRDIKLACAKLAVIIEFQSDGEEPLR